MGWNASHGNLTVINKAVENTCFITSNHIKWNLRINCSFHCWCNCNMVINFFIFITVLSAVTIVYLCVGTRKLFVNKKDLLMTICCWCWSHFSFRAKMEMDGNTLGYVADLRFRELVSPVENEVIKSNVYSIIKLTKTGKISFVSFSHLHAINDRDQRWKLVNWI